MPLCFLPTSLIPCPPSPGIRAGVPVDVRPVSAARMNLPPASVDAVVCVYGLSTARDAAALLREAARVLKPGKVRRCGASYGLTSLVLRCNQDY